MVEISHQQQGSAAIVESHQPATRIGNKVGNQPQQQKQGSAAKVESHSPTTGISSKDRETSNQQQGSAAIEENQPQQQLYIYVSVHA